MLDRGKHPKPGDAEVGLLSLVRNAASSRNGKADEKHGISTGEA